MSEQPKYGLLLSLLPIMLLAAVDIFALYLQPYAKALPHLSVAVLIAQLLCIVVFVKGEICNGQRARLIKANLYCLAYWIVWLILSLFSTYHYILTDIVCLCGIMLTIAIWQQPQDELMRRSILILGALLGGLGIVTYFFLFMDIPPLNFLQYNFFAQLISGILLAHLLLLIARNRLQGFIALLPLAAAATLFINALVVLGLLVYAQSSAVIFSNELAVSLYFLLHLVCAAILAIFIFRKWTFDYYSLFLLLFISASFPLWMTFAYL
ncbi:hypothetical protein [Caviibacterium pharyngocola]|uniref:Uncharacterized protein n=1 Tax=Caviibacterium pharyngocola TaxID=28159 RepID=A0A2M8RUN1_9PAST|nr:hypothetical protein [Caviibacterium pharyngocola]PJG82587.1 hypothetical protein CVP04_08580 [Caviibacterium pharyngocola]